MAKKETKKTVADASKRLTAIKSSDDEKSKHCAAIQHEIENILSEHCENKANVLEPCVEGLPCACSTGTSGKVDLIILIDTSGSMRIPAQSVSAAGEEAIKNAQEECPTNLRTVWLGVDGQQPKSGGLPGWATALNFNQTHEDYLKSAGYAGPYFHDQPPNVTFPGEQGADAIADLSAHFDWRPGACRAIFYISDTTLDADRTHIPGDDVATGNAINQANNNSVTVFTHLVDPPQYDPASKAQVEKNFQDLADQTGGIAIIGGTATADLYQVALRNAICNACGGCTELNLPDVSPCFSISWGDDKCDGFETDDFEVICITACNCYSNITFSNLIVGYVEVVDSSGKPVPVLPDDTPSVEVRPFGPICFGDIGPCIDREANCKTRELVVHTRGAKEGPYKLQLKAICFNICYGIETETCFDFELCPS